LSGHCDYLIPLSLVKTEYYYINFIRWLFEDINDMIVSEKKKEFQPSLF